MLVDMIEPGATSDSAVLPADGGQFRQFRDIKNCHCGIRIASDGNVYSLSNDGLTWQFVGAWLLVGLNTSFWVSRTIDSGSLLTDAGAGPLLCDIDRDYSFFNISLGTTETTTLTLDLSDDVSGSPIIASVQYTLAAELA